MVSCLPLFLHLAFGPLTFHSPIVIETELMKIAFLYINFTSQLLTLKNKLGGSQLLQCLFFLLIPSLHPFTPSNPVLDTTFYPPYLTSNPVLDTTFYPLLFLPSLLYLPNHLSFFPLLLPLSFPPSTLSLPYSLPPPFHFPISLTLTLSLPLLVPSLCLSVLIPSCDAL